PKKRKQPSEANSPPPQNPSPKRRKIKDTSLEEQDLFNKYETDEEVTETEAEQTPSDDYQQTFWPNDGLISPAMKVSFYRLHLRNPPKMAISKPKDPDATIYENSPWAFCERREAYENFKNYVQAMIDDTDTDGIHRYLNPKFVWNDQTLEDQRRFIKRVLLDFPIFKHQDGQFVPTAVASLLLRQSAGYKTSRKKQLKLRNAASGSASSAVL
ncbi:10643_t:CDS:2, partial [Acaulospora colombiana]